MSGVNGESPIAASLPTWRISNLISLACYLNPCVRFVEDGAGIAMKTAMIADDLRTRTRQFALDVISFCVRLPSDDLCRIARPQLLRAATGVAANYRAACRSRSSREFAARLAVVIEEADEGELWLDVLDVNHRGDAGEVKRLIAEAAELRAIMAASRSTTLDNLRRRQSNR